MPEKLKLKCPQCGSWFHAANRKRTLCPACFAKAERARMLARSQAAVVAKHAPVVSASSTLTAQTLPGNQSPSATTLAVASRETTPSQTQPSVATIQSSPLTHASGRPTRPPREPKARLVVPPFQPSEAEIALIERRYAELALPAEFDGIRTQISRESGISIKIVKRVVHAYRTRMHLPSWWETQRHPLTDDQVELVRNLYAPLLPLPPVGVHRTIAQQLNLNSMAVYDAIGIIRQNQGLAQFNVRADHPSQNDSASAPLPDPKSDSASVA